MDDNKVDQEQGLGKKPYKTPRLQVYGNVQGVTRGGSGANYDGRSGRLGKN